MFVFRHDLDLRIDLLLGSSRLAEACDACHIHKAPRS